MIGQLKAINFKGNSEGTFQVSPQGINNYSRAVNGEKVDTLNISVTPKAQTTKEQFVDTSVEEPIKQKTPVAEKMHKAKSSLVHILKGFNNVTDVSTGFIKGAGYGVATTALLGFIGKNIKEGEGKIIASLGSMFKNAANIIWSGLKLIPSIFKEKTPWDTIKMVAGSPKRFYKEYLNNNKKTATIATVAGALVLVCSTIMGKINANRKNAKIDHSINEGHNKY